MGSICCGSCWSHCRRRDGDGGEKDSSKGTSYCYVNPETQTSNQTIELRNISASKYPELARRYLEEKATMYVKQLEEYRRAFCHLHGISISDGTHEVRIAESGEDC